MGYNWNWGIFFEASPEGGGTYGELLFYGLTWTCLTASLAWIIALSLGMTIGVMRTLQPGFARSFATGWVELFRNIPILVQLFLWFFVIPELLPQSWGTAIKTMPNSAFYTAVLGLGLATSSRVAEQIRAGIEALPKGQRMAARALGLTPVQVYAQVLVPMGFRIALPPLTSELLNLVKNSAIALTIGLMELTARARSIQEYSFQVFEAFTAATIMYILLNATIVIVARGIERRLAVPGYTGPR
jgi:glutamate/aspartate transport system permease protein